LGICKSLLQAGANVLAIDIQSEKLNKLKNLDFISFEKSYAIFVADITREDSCNKIVEEAVQRFGGIDIIINCAAPVRDRDALGSLSLKDFSRQQKLMLEAPILLANLASKYLSKSGSGVIVNISSILGGSIAPDQASFSYHVGKASLDQLTRWLAVRLGNLGIRVNAIAPGLVDRDVGVKISEHPKFSSVIRDITPLPRVGTYRDIGNAVVFLCSDWASYITGHVLVIDGGLSILEAFGAASKAVDKSSERTKLVGPR